MQILKQRVLTSICRAYLGEMDCTEKIARLWRRELNLPIFKVVILEILKF